MRATRPEPGLSASDESVLKALFDSETTPDYNSSEPDQVSSNTSAFETEQSRLQNTVDEIIRPLSKTDPNPDAVTKAIDQLDNVIYSHPSFAPAYVNRAQAIRLLHNEAIFTDKGSIPMGHILADLSQAITLANPKSTSAKVSNRQAQVLSAAHMHRGYLIHNACRLNSLQPLPQSLRLVGVDRLEEMASRDFAVGGRYGDKIGQQLSIYTNPYAKMCGAIVSEALRKEMT
jgi:hypothetical protein